LALFCNVQLNAVIEALDADTIYDVPLLMRKEKLDERVLTKFKLSTKTEPKIENWKEYLGKLKNPTSEINIGLIGKYVELPDAYKSIVESFVHAGAMNECQINLRCISSEAIENGDPQQILKDLHGILVAPGFGERGIEGKITAVQYTRENQIPFFGICLGMQCAMIEFGRNVLNLKEANSTEIDPNTKHPIIDIMEDQKNIKDMGGTMRLGAYECIIQKGTKAHSIYEKTKINERHRHRYEFNDKYKERFEKAGMIASGINPKTQLVEIMELKSHPWFIGVQFHPELQSTVLNPQPLFVKFIKAALAYKKEYS